MDDAVDPLQRALADRYTVERELGAGGMATVYLARDQRHDRTVAIKVLRPELAAALGPERFAREIRVAARLNHPHILPLFDSGDADGFLYYVMPVVDGQSLRERLRREGQLAIDESLRIATQVAAALDYAHQHGILHRDIKPENVMLHQGEAVVTDFGIALALDSAAGSRLTATGLAVGTPQYMSPEQADGSTAPDRRSDVYALGCLLYEMLAGEPPHTGPTANAILARKLAAAAPAVAVVRPTVPPHVAAAIARALERLPADRFPTAAAFAAALAEPGDAPAATGARTTIAVLPFANMSADPDNEFFSDGVTEEVINAIAAIPALRVTARTSAFQFKGKQHDVRDIGRRLNVGTVLEGSVRRSGGRVRVTAQLVDVAGGHHLWSERFDRDLEDIFAIQDEIALAIADRLKAELTRTARAETARPDAAAYDAYLRGRFHRRELLADPAHMDKARDGYREAIERDPTFAAAHSALAELLVLTAIGFARRPSRELMPDAKAAAERALALDPALAEAHLARALVAMYYEWDYAAAWRGIERAMALNASSVDAHFWAEFYHTYVERDLDKALAANTRAAALDPLDLNIAGRRGQVLIVFGRLDEAIASLQRTRELDPDRFVTHLELADAYCRTGDARLATAAAERALELSGGALSALGVGAAVFGTTGDKGRARQLLQEMRQRREGGYAFPFWLAVAHAAVGEIDRAFELLEEASRDRDPNLLYITATPPPLGWQNDPRFGAILKGIGLGHLARA